MAADRLETLQRYIDSFAADAGTLRAALADAGTPEPARRLIAGALNYVLDALDIFPDHYKGLGLADDALVFRIAAARAVAAGATHMALGVLADDAGEAEALLGDVAQPFGLFVDALPDRAVRGRTGAKVVADKDTRVAFEADLDRELARHTPHKIDAKLGAEQTLKELIKMTRASLKRAGLIQ